MELKTTTYQKIGIVYGILLILVVIALGIRFFGGNKLQNTKDKSKTNTIMTTAEQKENLPGKLSLVIDAPSYKVGDNIELTILYAAPSKVLDGMDITLRYDPSLLNAIGITPTGSFKIYPRKDIDNKEGVVKVIVLDSADVTPLPQEKVSFGKVQMKALKAGTVQVNFDFTAGATSKTTMTETGTSKNILGEASGVTIWVTE